MKSRDLLGVVRNTAALLLAFSMAACGATESDGEDLGEISQALTTLCPAGYPNNGGIVINGTAAGETINGTPGGDCIFGHGGNDIINGLGGNDFLVGGAGDDTINGGDGNDHILSETGNDALNGDAGDDILNARVNNGGFDILHGGDGNDQLIGADSTDQAFGEAGNDNIKGNGGDDFIDGGDGDDYLDGSAGNDTIVGGLGVDKVYGSDGDDTLSGDAGDDFMFGGNGDDTINGNDGVDTIRGEAGNDALNGDNGNDLIYGGDGDDTIHGNAGNDVVYGEAGNDHIFGDDGEDRLAGGAGVDALEGGLGNDLFDEGGDGGSMVGDAGNDAAIQTAVSNGALGTDACGGVSCELPSPPINCPSGCSGGRRCAREVSFCIFCQSNSECAAGQECIPTLGCRPRESNCGNGLDDDADGAVDCQDADCADSCPGSFGGGVGNWHGCVKSTAGGVSCWGRNNLCQVGFPSSGGSTPGAVTGITTATDVRIGSYNSCALLAGGTVQCWGASTNGALGDGGVFTGDCTKTPVDVVGLAGVTQLSVGAGHACALIGGSLMCWGQNSNGQLGANSPVFTHSTPIGVVGITTATQVSGGSQNTCAVLADGTVRCWGRNHRGQLGNNTQGNPSSVPVPVASLTNIAQVATGQDFACARSYLGNVFCWGDNAFGQLGNGTVGGVSKVPVQATITSVVSLQVGASHACAIRQGGVVSCWGLNTDGQIGIGTTSAAQATPIATAPPVNGVALEMGRAFSCAKDLAGTVSCWGDNFYGQVAADAPADHTTAFVKTGLPP